MCHLIEIFWFWFEQTWHTTVRSPFIAIWGSSNVVSWLSSSKKQPFSDIFRWMDQSSVCQLKYRSKHKIWENNVILLYLLWFDIFGFWDLSFKSRPPHTGVVTIPAKQAKQSIPPPNNKPLCWGIMQKMWATREVGETPSTPNAKVGGIFTHPLLVVHLMGYEWEKSPLGEWHSGAAGRRRGDPAAAFHYV